MSQQKEINENIKSRLLLILLFFCFYSVAFQAQETEVTGTVIDDTGTPIPGVTIIVSDAPKQGVENKIKGTTTDFDGRYTIKVNSKKSRLAFTYLGYKKQTISIGLKRIINISMVPDVSQLEEIVIVGYGTQSKKDVTGAITKINTESIERTTNATVEQALTGKIAGVNTLVSDGTPGSGIRIRIRGGTSINANNEPLYVIDGLPIEVDYAVSEGQAEIAGPSSSPLADLDPSSIESINVLKDASAAAIYGARGANGVVIITTKSGKSGKTKITFDSSITSSTVPKSRFVDLLTTSQYGELLINRERYENGIEVPDVVFGDDNLTAEQEQARYDGLPNTDWQKELYRTGYISKYSLNATGGNAKNLFSVGGTYFKNEGAIVNSFFKRYNFNVNIQNKLSDKLKIKTVLLPSYSIQQGPVSGGDNNQSKFGIVLRALTRRTDRGVGIVEDDVDGELGVWVDPVTEAKRASNISNTFSFRGNTHVTYEFAKGLRGGIRLGANISDGKTKSYYTKDYGRGFLSNGIGTRYHYQNITWNNQNTLQYRTAFGNKNKHKLNVLGVFEQTYQSRESEYVSVRDFPVETLGFNALQNGLIPSIPDTFITETNLKSYLVRVNYGFRNLYNVTLSMRADGSSRFGPQNKWGYFPAVGFSWNAHNQKFLKNIESINSLKLRLSYGQTGNQGIPAYGSFAVLGVSNTIFGDEVNAGLAVTSLPNPNLKWEFTDQYDIGIDAGFFDSRVSLTVDAYYKKTEDLLLQVPIPLSTGFGSRLTNVGNVENKGLEFALNTVNLDGNFKWSTDFTFSLNDNKVLNLGGVSERKFEDQFTGGKFTGLIRVGESLGNWIGYQTNGVFTYEDFDTNGNVIDSSFGTPSTVNTDSKPKLGDLKYVDQLTEDTNGDGIPDAGNGIIDTNDETIIARTQPKHFGSMYNHFSYKGFELGLLFTYKYGFDVINGNKYRMVATGYGPFNKTADLANAWSPVNTDTNVPRADYQDVNFTDRFVEDGSFIRLQSVNFSYNLPLEAAKKIGFQSLKLYSNIDNLFVWTKYSGYDPEVSVANGQKSITSQNLDYGAYPRTLNVTLGIKVGF